MTNDLRVLVTCPPMLGMIREFAPVFRERGVELISPEVVQTLSENELVNLLPTMDGWIAGDDPVNATTLAAGKAGRLRAVVKWGVGVDNVDFGAAAKLGLPVKNTPHAFGAEVADVAIGYVIGLARQTYFIDRSVRSGDWPKPAGISLATKKVGLIGLGDIGRNIARRLQALGMIVLGYDPAAENVDGVEITEWPKRVEEADFIVLACALTPASRHILNDKIFHACKRGVRIVNVARGPLIDENALIRALEDERVHSAALDVFEVEPLPTDSPIRGFERCILGSHNGSNTADAVRATSRRAIDSLFEMLALG